MARDTEVKYVGTFDEVEVPVPEADRSFDEPRYLYVKQGEKIKVGADHAKGLVAGGAFELVKAEKKGGDA